METRRPTVPEAEEILGRYFPVLDHGFVALVDYMGSDEDVERAARVSYGYGTRRTSQTRGLIRYLRRHHHTTPFEMVEIKFHCAMPIFVARQWIRHRTACLAEGTHIHFDLYELKIEEVFERFRPDRQRDGFFERDRVRDMRVRQMDEEAFAIRHSRVVNAFDNGVKPIVRMTLADGKSIECTVDHRFHFSDGWKTLAEATGLSLDFNVASWRFGDYYLYVNGAERTAPALHRSGISPQRSSIGRWTSPRAGELHAHHVVPVWADPHRARDAANLTTACAGCQRRVQGRRPRVAWIKVTVPRLVRIERFEYVGEKRTFDLEVEGPHHNFVANGIVTHNSVNEYSGRYSLLPLLYYRPPRAQLQAQSRANRQGRGGAPLDVLYDEAVARWDALRAQASAQYEWLVGHDVARELARIDLPLSVYTQWYWKVDLHNLLHFLMLRVDPHAQAEIRAYARVMAGMLRRVAPLSFEAWVDYELAGVRLSRVELALLRRLVRVEPDPTEDVRLRPSDHPVVRAAEMGEAGLSAREIAEFVGKLGHPPTPEDFALDPAAALSAEAFAARMAAAVPRVDRR